MGKAIISVGALALTVALTAPVFAQQEQTNPTPEQPPALAENPPARYVVVKGDTLWGIAARFLRDPWRWPDIWGLNRDEIKNPHWIYPGNVIILDFSGRTPRLHLEGQPGWQLMVTKLSPKIRTEKLAAAIPSIPPIKLDAFATKSLVVGENELASAPKIVAAPDNRIVLSAGDTAFVEGLAYGDGRSYQVLRPGRPFIDPDSQEVLGHEALYLGEAEVKEFGEISTVQLTKANQEIVPGDRLVSIASSAELPYMPHAPQGKINGKIIAAASKDMISEIGPYSVVILNRGARDGLEIGNVLAVSRAERTVNPSYGTEYMTTDTSAPVMLPPRRYGLVFVFRVFERVSYALIMNATRPLNVYDAVQNP